MPKRVQPALGSELREGRRLVIAALRQALDRLCAEHVDAAADPVLEARSLAEGGHEIVLELNDAEGRLQRHDRDRGGAATPPVERQELTQIGVHELVAVQDRKSTRLNSSHVRI